MSQNNENTTPDGVIRDDLNNSPERPSYEPLGDGEDRIEEHGPEPVLDDRGISPVGGSGAGSKAAKIGALVALVVLGGAGVMLTMNDKPQTADVVNQDDVVSQYSRYEDTQKGNAPPPPLPADPDAPQPIEVDDNGARPAGLAGEAQPDPRIALLEQSRRAPIMALTSGRGGGAGSAGTQSAGGPDGQRGGGLTSALVGSSAAERSEHELDNMSGTTINRSRASMLPNRNYLVTAGSQIPCSLQTAMDSSTPGFVSCIVNNDVYSDNGNVVLLEKGTRVLGEYRGALRQGQTRLFVVWNRAVTPRGVAVNLASPASDSLGRAGMGGDIETFFWQRFGGALMLSVVDDAVALGSRDIREARNTISTPSEAATVALQNSINIPPRLRKDQGETVSIFAANDFDFSRVYGLRPR